MKKKKFILPIIYLIAAILYIFGPLSIFKICEAGDHPMKCYWSSKAEIGVALILVVVAVLYYFSKTTREKTVLAILATALGIVAILIPSVLIGGCGMKTMPCQKSTFPAYYVTSAILIVISIFDVIDSYLKDSMKGDSADKL
ncbi:MAG TPA: DUF4418 family protein [Lachnospiraceae bacterium]|nr:DUF4418 family protein [Lachnospiraceae bacterium]